MTTRDTFKDDSDSESLVNEENFNYALWEVAAIVGAVIAFRIIKKQVKSEQTKLNLISVYIL